MGRASVDNAQALSILRAMPEAAMTAAREAVNETAQRVAVLVRQRSARVYNLTEEELRPFVDLQEAPKEVKNTAKASVTLKIRALPISVFRPRVSMRAVPVRLFGRTPARLHRVPHVEVMIRRAKGVQLLKGFFPLLARSDGPIPADDKVRRRVGQTLSRRKGPDGNKLTGFRFVTFPKKWLAELLPRLQNEAGDQLIVAFDAAYRGAKGRLRRND